jgi:uncharacterized protein
MTDMQQHNRNPKQRMEKHSILDRSKTPFNPVTTPLSLGEGLGGEASLIDALTLRIISFDAGDPMRIQHLLKVHRFAQLIGRAEGLDAHTLFVLESTAVLHDIGIHPAEAKYGSSNGKYQEQEGPAPARAILESMYYDEADIERICWLIAHHHTYNHIDAPDYQILVEADFLVNLYEDHISEHGIEAARNNIFKTQTGLKLLKMIYEEKYEVKNENHIKGEQPC